MSPLMARIFEISASVPIEDWRSLPRDLSFNHDHYSYGTPRRRLRLPVEIAMPSPRSFESKESGVTAGTE